MSKLEFRRKRGAMKHYDRIADLYDSLYKHEQDKKIYSTLKYVGLAASDVVLDAGCGSGLLFPWLDGKVKVIVGVDISRCLLRIAASRSGGSSGTETHLILADASYLPIRKEIFDKIFAITLMQDVPEVDVVVEEIFRVAKNSSEIIITWLKKGGSVKGLKKAIRDRNARLSIIDVGGECKDLIIYASKLRDKNK
ncbi:MAG: class I SAM-dependent methyltransferase [Nitrososphaerota archaeon]|nr:class I SAM-dependent methyltransferase [Candidatus Bathyarchaeota archaeon]MDW8048840.1 class I SAM-dependent methyltransferase [Nitrososphaerota archaeon]